jgi:hypothetical protein
MDLTNISGTQERNRLLFQNMSRNPQGGFVKRLNTICLGVTLLLCQAARSQQTSQPLPPSSNRHDGDPASRRRFPDRQAETAQQKTSAEQEAADNDSHAAYPFESPWVSAIISGATLCGHLVDDGTFLDAVSFNAAGQMAFVIRWLDWRPGTIVHSALLTGADTCFVTDGAIVDGKVIARAMPNSLAVSNQHAFVAWEGEYWNSPLESTTRSPHRGAFIGNKFAFEIDQRNATPATMPDKLKFSSDFRWSNVNEVLVPKPGIVLIPASPVIAAPARPAALPKAAPTAMPKEPAAANIGARRPPEAAPKPATPKVQRKPAPCPPFRPCPAAK